ncbi:hypothetical protein [Niallia sp. 01092]|uniref:hypothetical protein n=1 Tax=unclassified Niallia TaxID=2837522 RepID=UPI003FD4E244
MKKINASSTLNAFFYKDIRLFFNFKKIILFLLLILFFIALLWWKLPKYLPYNLMLSVFVSLAGVIFTFGVLEEINREEQVNSDVFQLLDVPFSIIRIQKLFLANGSSFFFCVLTSLFIYFLFVVPNQGNWDWFYAIFIGYLPCGFIIFISSLFKNLRMNFSKHYSILIAIIAATYFILKHINTLEMNMKVIIIITDLLLLLVFPYIIQWFRQKASSKMIKKSTSTKIVH